MIRLSAWFMVLVTLVVTGCQTVQDPSCDVQQELADRDGFRFLHKREVCWDETRTASWNQCACRWTPQCGPALQCGRDWGADRPSTEQVFALPPDPPSDRSMPAVPPGPLPAPAADESEPGASIPIP